MPPILPYILSLIPLSIWLGIGTLYRKYKCNYYLYLIPFADGKYFKLGVTNDLHRRLSEHKREGYEFDSKKVLYIKQEKYLITALEVHLKQITPSPKLSPYTDLKGSTEVRHRKYFKVAKKALKGYLVRRFKY